MILLSGPNDFHVFRVDLALVMLLSILLSIGICEIE